jgi:Rrf2 family protein
MQLSMTGEYTIRALIYLASHPHGSVHRVADVAKNGEIPEKYFRKILAVMMRAGFVQSLRGVNGGIRLAVPADKIDMLSVFEATEGKMLLNSCLLDPGICHRSSWCAMHLLWLEIQLQMKASLRSKTLADLVKTNTINLQALVAAR